eukprot:TRINITY_DN63474_c0_g1_i1.p1 TRINITY_DN63474_c0_g1~~TRINITY_DN63474_c0_g1_i1.p1  ORF type:complete len:338 (+),score=55.91 TRINITY_DN63474_c0_g1_i1:105-1118(+)
MPEQEQPESQPVQEAPSPKVDESLYPRKCPHCSKTFPTSTRYHKHLRTHSESKLFKCTFPGCAKSYKRKTHLTRHLASHRDDKPFRCTADNCKMSFSTRQKLDRHTKSVHTGLRCPDCGQRFRKKAKLEQHRQLVHRSLPSGEAVPADAQSPVRCADCSIEFTSVAALERHVARVHRPGGRQITCRQCQETFGSFKLLVCHRRENHAKTYVCDECGQSFRRSSHLKEHKDRIHRQAVVLCEQPGCLRSFATKRAMRQHFRVAHQGLQEFSCRLCPKVFAYKHVLRLHYRQVHGTSPSRADAPADAEEHEMKRIKTLSPAELLAELFAEPLPDGAIEA